MSKHIVIIVALMLVASAGYASPPISSDYTYATEEELRSAPGSAGYPVDEDAEADDEPMPVGDCNTDEGEDGFEHDAEPDPGDGDAGVDDDSAPEGDEDDTEGGC